MANFYDKLLELLKKDPRFVATDGTFLRNIVYEKAMAMDEDLISLLLSDSEISSRFFKDVGSVKVFDKTEFGWVINNKQFLPDSYTRFKDKIGLADSNGDLISTSQNVELVFPYKDCVLEGGQTKEDQKRDEIFYNETLAPDEIDRLLAPKVFTNAKKYTKDGVKTITEFSENDNLIIKGNNLLALSSLLERYRGKIKLIYIDPPYNTGNDTFGYNDSFTRSTWLTFMKNRLTIAQELLSDGGCIFIQIDDSQQAYLKVLCDEIFKEENFVNCISVKMSESTGVKMDHTDKRLPKIKEYILVYKKGLICFNDLQINKGDWDNEYRLLLTNISFEEVQFVKSVMNNDEADDSDIEKADSILAKVEYENVEKFIKKNNISKDEKLKFKYDNAWRIVRDAATSDGAKTIADIKRKNIKGNFFLIKTSKGEKYLIKNDYDSDANQPRMKILFADDYLTYNPCDFWQDIKTTGIENEGSVKFKNGKKPERLIERILALASNENDIILDFFSGSGTTAAVAMKMHRQFIACEQLESHIELSIDRLKNVIDGEQSGVSSSNNWKGGGSFISCDLKELNQKFFYDIQNANDDVSINKIYCEIMDSGFISYRIDPATIDNYSTEFENLSLSDKKLFLLQILDKNLLYVNYCDIDDKELSISDDDKKFTNSFYKRSN